MTIDTDLHIWLETQWAPGETVLVPHLLSMRTVQMRFTIDLVRSGGNGASRIRQHGELGTVAGQAAVLSRLAVKGSDDARCRMEITLREGERQVAVFHVDCLR